LSRARDAADEEITTMTTKPPCQCGNHDAFWSGDVVRVYACGRCHDLLDVDAAFKKVDEAEANARRAARWMAAFDRETSATK
jgi:hypothetical protein